ncbi:hypothetical protein [Vibrio fluvialis]|uniref:hypothetical protein n=1 Tax=Vibrio fluvialis TaxID=676 RepID=UPI0005C88C2B|nr:hypothetical protein [Vibrio fluvialis]
MKVFKIEDLYYNGVKDGVHSWDHPYASNPYYWHPDWLHIAEDATGLHPKQPLEVADGEEATEEDAKEAIVKHLNENQ